MLRSLFRHKIVCILQWYRHFKDKISVPHCKDSLAMLPAQQCPCDAGALLVLNSLLNSCCTHDTDMFCVQNHALCLLLDHHYYVYAQLPTTLNRTPWFYPCFVFPPNPLSSGLSTINFPFWMNNFMRHHVVIALVQMVVLF
jgi:hypothetical protein